MTAVDVDALDKLREAATSGEWQVRWQCPEEAHHHDWDEGWIADPYGATVAVVGERYTSAPLDAAYIVAMHAALPELLAEVRRGRALRKDLTAIVNEMEDDESISIPPNVPLLIEALRAALAAVDAP